MLRFLRSRRGAEFVEAAVTIPIVVLVMLAVVQFGMIVYASQMASEAARQGVRWGAVAQANQAGIAASQAASFASTAFAMGSPQVAVLAPGGVLGSNIKLRVTYEVPNFLGGLAGLFPGLPHGPFQVIGEATMRQEGWLQ
ncbi:MAG: pilus assembly protein [Chloroflexi bacterium]|nr:pilus assembly protein [Chloroflexota bacterium]